jgi:hypothetical protein
VICLAAVERLLNALSQPDIVDERQNIERAAKIVQFPQGLLSLVLATIGAEHSYHVRLRYILLRDRRHDPLHVRPLLTDQVVVGFASWFDEVVSVVFGVLEADKAVDLLMQVTIAWSELITENAQEPEVDLVGAVRIGRMAFGLDIRGVVVEQVVDVVALVLMRADDCGVNRHVIEHQRTSAHALLETEIFAGVAGVDGRNLRLDTLTVAAGVAALFDVVFLE